MLAVYLIDWHGLSMPITMLDPRRSLAADAVDVVVAFSQGGTMLAIYMDEMRKARRWRFKGNVISQEMMGL
jgi:hypothetical protein